jgi:hypothetical protein
MAAQQGLAALPRDPRKSALLSMRLRDAALKARLERALLDHDSQLANEASNFFQLGIVMLINDVRKALNAFFVTGRCDHLGIE